MGKMIQGSKMFSVGDGPAFDYSPMQIENLTLKLINWFKDPSCDRNFDDPAKAAKDVILACLNCVKLDGEIWKSPPHEFETRIKVMAAYDMKKGEGIKISRLKHPSAVRRLDREAEQSAKKAVNNIIPHLIDFDLQGFIDERVTALLDNFPELNNLLYESDVKNLGMLYAQQEVLNREIFMGGKRSISSILEDFESISKLIDAKLKTLDIHPESLRKRAKDRMEGTIGDLVAMLDGDAEFRNREKLWALQAATQLWYMHNHDNGDRTGPQISEVEMWHMTRTRPFSFRCKCGQKYDNIIQGFTPKDLREYLEENGVLLSIPAIPNIIQEVDIEGINEFIDALPLDQEAPRPLEGIGDGDALFGGNE